MLASLAARIALISLIALPGAASASPFNAGRIPADADGVGHLDMDALRQTSLHRLVWPKLNKSSNWNDVDVKLRPFLQTLLATTQGVSFWVTDTDTGAALIQVPDGRRIQAMLDRLPSRGQVRVGGYVARKLDFSDAKGVTLGSSDETFAAVVGNLLIITGNQKSLAKAIDAASGRTKSLGATRGVPEGARERGVFFFTALNHKLLDHIKDAAQSTTLRINMTSLTVHVGEVRGGLRIRARLMMASPQEAQQVKSMAEGIIALTSMAGDKDAAEVRRFTRGLKFTATGKLLEVSLAMASAELVKAIESGQ
jgi:hypothetical protein